MFVAIRDLRFARGRFTLIGSVVALITVLVGFLSGLTGGLATQNISAVLDLPADRIVFNATDGEEVAFADSSIAEAQAEGWADTPGVEAAQPVGITQTRAETAHSRAAVAAFGVPAGFHTLTPRTDGLVGLSAPAAMELDVTEGEEITIAGTEYIVDTIGGDAWYTHTPVVQMTLHDWQAQAAATGTPDAFATVLAVTGTPDWETADQANATVSRGVLASLTALSAFRSEIGSLLLMVAMLFAISGLVIGAFFTVWTMQRKPDIAILKALGATTGSLIRDALGQALIVLITGITIGTLLVVGLGAIAGTALPFFLSPLTTLLPALIMTALGLAGAAFALRTVTAADPLTALGSTR